jgi:hypothetical protein
MLLEGVHQRVRHGRATHTNNCAALCALWSGMVPLSALAML